MIGSKEELVALEKKRREQRKRQIEAQPNSDDRGNHKLAMFFQECKKKLG